MSQRTRSHSLLATLSLALVTLTGVGAVQAATITVTSIEDGSLPSECTLRDATLAANDNTAHGACASGAPGLDEIVFAPGVRGTLLLSNGQLELTESVHIVGPGATRLTIDAQSLSRIFYINTDETNTTRLAGMTLTGGRTAETDYLGNGGAVYSVGELELVDAVVSGNSTGLADSPGGGLFVGVHISLLRSKVSGNWTEGDGSPGGGITVPIGRITVTDSSISGNWTEGDYSGAGGLLMAFIFNDATITGSTISGNATYGQFSDAGGLAIGGGTTIVNSTISGNSSNGPDSGGGGMSLSGFLTLLNSTVVDNTSIDGPAAIRLVSPDSAFKVSNSVIANSDGVQPLCTREIDVGDSVGNLITDASCGTASTVHGASVAFGDLMLGPLADNGGRTLTHALLAGSAAIDVADTAVCVSPPVNSLDQRGAARLVDGNADGDASCDVGAYEAGDTDKIFMDGFEASVR